jgi:hypothetical protein
MRSLLVGPSAYPHVFSDLAQLPSTAPARPARILASQRRKVLSETYRNFAIADFGRFASSMSAISAHSCGVGCQRMGVGFIP